MIAIPTPHLDALPPEERKRLAAHAEPGCPVGGEIRDCPYPACRFENVSGWCRGPKASKPRTGRRWRDKRAFPRATGPGRRKGDGK